MSTRCLQRRTAQMLERSQSLLQYNTTLQVCRIDNPLTMDPTLLFKMKVIEPMMDLVRGLQPWYRHMLDVIMRKQEYRNRRLSTLIVNIDTDVQAD